MIKSSSHTSVAAVIFIKLNHSAAQYIHSKFNNTFNFLNKSDFISKNKTFIK